LDSGGIEAVQEKPHRRTATHRIAAKIQEDFANGVGSIDANIKGDWCKIPEEEERG